MRFTDHHTFGKSAAARFYMEEDAGGGNGGDSGAATGQEAATGNEGDSALHDFIPGDGKDTGAASQDRVAGEKPPDFGNLFGKKPAAKPAEGEEGDKAPAEAKKPATGQPRAKSSAPEGEAKPPKATEKTPEAKKPAEAAPAKPAEAAAAPKAAKILTDAEIDALQPSPGAPTKVIQGFKAMRETMKEHAQGYRAAIAEKEAIAKEVETLKAQVGKLPEEVDKELQSLRQFHLLFNAQQDPIFQKEYEGKIQAAEEGVYSLLTKHGLDPKFIEEIKEAGAKHGDIEKWPQWTRLINSFSNPLDRQAVIDALKGRRDAIEAKGAKLNQLSTDRDGYFKTIQEKDKAEKDSWSKELADEAMRVGATFEPAIEKDIPEGASAEVKAAIEAHNKRVGEIAKKFQENAIAAYKRDPKAIARMAFSEVQAAEETRLREVAESELEKTRLQLKAAEDRLAKIKTAGRVAHVDAPAAASESGARPKTTVESGKIGGDGSAALSKFFNR